ncbi:hypothetical protein FS837_001686 [Tulasnella sp. UAMH 9824]|nr:hypothetical protein FS837_001686 [Tulasnella sp. UAMH 9824]
MKDTTINYEGNTFHATNTINDEDGDDIVPPPLAPRLPLAGRNDVHRRPTVDEEKAEEDEDDIVPPLPAAPRSPRASRTVVHRRPYILEQDVGDPDPISAPPPSFAQSEFETGWGSTSYVELTAHDIELASSRLAEKPVLLEALRASSIAGNGMYGSVFYAFPAVAAAAGIFSPLALLIACLILFLFRPILRELGSAIRMNGAIYSYLLQSSGKTMALVGAAAIFLDSVATASVSAATASAYLSGEFDGALYGMKEAAVALGILALLAVVGLFNLRGSSVLAASFTVVHLATMAILMIASVIAWARHGSHTLRENWELRPRNGTEVAKAIFYGTCLAFLGVTGFETIPTYIENIKPSSYPRTLDVCIYTVLTLNAPLMLLVYALLPTSDILSGGNILSLLAEQVAGKWLRILVVVDCMLVIGGGGVLLGMVAMSSMLQRLAKDRVIPSAFFRTLPTGGAHWSILFFLFVAVILYASSGFNLVTISSVFAVTFPFVLLLYSVSNILLKFDRDRLPRDYQAKLGVTVLAFLAMVVVLAGNIIPTPKILGLFLAYFIVVLACLVGLQSRIQLARVAMWLYDQNFTLQKWRYTKGWDSSIVRWMTRLRKRPVCVWVKVDDIYNLVEAILYVRKNEMTARIILLHAYENAIEIPTEMEANVKILDEAFPGITIDLIFLKGKFNPILVEAASAKLEVPKSQMFMNTMGCSHGFSLSDYGGVRVANL